jgi:hypothetical protein
MRVNTGVVVSNKKHERAYQAGVIDSVPQEISDTVDVKFDVDLEVVQMKIADLVVL